MEDENECLKCELEVSHKQKAELDQILRGFDDKAIISPDDLMEYPSHLRKNLTRVMETISDSHELHYVKAIAEPFHPDSHGVRVPQILPRESVTFSSYKQFDLENGQNYFIVTNFEKRTIVSYVAMQLTGPETQTFQSAIPIRVGVTVAEGAEDYSADLIPLPFNTTVLKTRIQTESDPIVRELYTKCRSVAAGVRFFKTSTSDSESGVLDQVYSRDGAMLNDSDSLRDIFNRPSTQSDKMYLAGTQNEVRGRNGFLTQCSYRPHDEQGMEMLRPENDKQNALYSDEITPIWFAYSDGGYLVRPVQ